MIRRTSKEFKEWMLMYVGVVELLRNLPLYGGRFDSPLIRDLESRRDVLTGQSTGYGCICEYGAHLREKVVFNVEGELWCCLK